MSHTRVGGRQVYLRARDNQSIRICTETNVRGEWEHEFWLNGGQHVTAAEVANRADVADLVKWLLERGARTWAIRPLAVGDEAERG
jgi:hypothetical protein